MGEPPTGRAEILSIKGSAKAFGGQALRISFDIGFAGAIWIALDRCVFPHRNAFCRQPRNSQIRRQGIDGDAPDQWSKLTDRRSQVREET